MSLPDVYQNCTACNSRKKIVCDSSKGGYKFEPHYKPGTTTECSGSGAAFTPFVKVKPVQRIQTRTKCPICWQQITLIRDSETNSDVLARHKTVSGSNECRGSLSTPRKKEASA